jgi:ribosomal protein S18 acetylase RimI-like enzyme
LHQVELAAFTMPFQLRPAQESDAAAVAAVHAASSHAAYEDFMPDAPQLPMDKRKAFWRDAIEYGEPLVHVAVNGPQVVGFVGYDRSRDPKSKNTCGELWALYVDPGHWGEGIGSALWESACEGLQEEGCTEVTVWVPLRNERALRLLERCGFAREAGSVKTVSMSGVQLEEIRLRRSLA